MNTQIPSLAQHSRPNVIKGILLFTGTLSRTRAPAALIYVDHFVYILMKI